ncbi:Asx homology domain-containing protein [Xylariaceae sp. FL0662B]|nr:Asx homology domain-containing protein [Xylariaceae sp. FL0662B]
MGPRRKSNGISKATRKPSRAVKPPRRLVEASSSDELSTKPQPQPDSSDENGQTLDEIVVQTLPRTKSRSSQTPEAKREEATPECPQLRATPDKKEILKDSGRGDGEDELAGEEPIMKKPKIIIKEMSGTYRKGRSKYDNPDEMLTNPRSPLATTKLRDLLCSSKAWDILSLDEKRSILAKFPDEQEITDAGSDAARPNVAALRNNNNFRHDIARYQEGLKEGHHDPEWIRQAQSAHKKREIGFYNEYLAAKFEEDWGMKMPEQEDITGGASESSDRTKVEESTRDNTNVKGGDDAKESTIEVDEPLKNEEEVKDSQDTEDGRAVVENGNIQSGDEYRAEEGVKDDNPTQDEEATKTTEPIQTDQVDTNEAVNHNNEDVKVVQDAASEDKGVNNDSEPMDSDVRNGQDTKDGQDVKNKEEDVRDDKVEHMDVDTRTEE